MKRFQEIERSIIKKFRKDIWAKFLKGIEEYDLIKPGDKIAVCISGGKDSMLLALLFKELKCHGRIPFEVEYMVMNPGYSPENKQQIIENTKLLHFPIHMFETNIFEVVEEIEDSPCFLCARMRRGYLYKYAQKLGCNKIALGHHFDDVVETILMGMLYGAQIQTMMPKLYSSNYEGMELIRPMYLIKEKDIMAWRDSNHLTFIECACKMTENRVNDDINSSKRKEIKELIKSLKEINENVDINIFRSIHDVNLNTIIGYHKDDLNYNFLDNY